MSVVCVGSLAREQVTLLLLNHLSVFMYLFILLRKFHLLQGYFKSPDETHT